MFEHMKSDDEFCGNYISPEECKASGIHGNSVDDDGYCNNCGDFTIEDEDYDTLKLLERKDLA